MDRAEAALPRPKHQAPRPVLACSPTASSFPRKKRKCHRAEDAQERRDVIPLRLLAEVEKRKRDKYDQRHDLLDDLQLKRRIGLAAPAIGRNHQAIPEERDPPSSPGSPARASDACA